MLVIMGNNTEFQRVANLVIEKLDFDVDINVSVFETNIRGKFDKKVYFCSMTFDFQTLVLHLT
jgi:hypothetical protein